MKPRFFIAAMIAGIALGPSGLRAAAADVELFRLPPTRLSHLGNPQVTEAVLDRAQREGLKCADRPSLGSGLARVGPDEYVGLTDRGPTGTLAVKGRATKTFPLPEFCPTLVRFKLAGGEIQITRCLPLRDAQGQLLPGRSAAPDPAGLDPEAIRVLPDGKYLLGDESAPSIAVMSTNGNVLVRYTPRSKPLPGANYRVNAMLPDSVLQRRQNRGFECLAVSRDGQFAYAILQAPLGDDRDPRYRDSRVLRVLKLDITAPEDARLVGEFLAPARAARDYGRKQAQDKITWSDADCVGPDRLLVIERGKDAVKLLLLDLSAATNILDHPLEAGLQLEASTDVELARLGVSPARTEVLHTIRQLPGITKFKLEGLVALDARTVLLAHDNDFGGDNAKTSTAAMVWRLALPQPIPDFR